MGCMYSGRMFPVMRNLELSRPWRPQLGLMRHLFAFHYEVCQVIVIKIWNFKIKEHDNNNGNNNELAEHIYRVTTTCKRRPDGCIVPGEIILSQWNYGDVIMSTIASQITSLTIVCLLNRLFRHRSKQISKLRLTGLFEGNSPVTGEFPAQRASNAENDSIRWLVLHCKWWFLQYVPFGIQHITQW